MGDGPSSSKWVINPQVRSGWWTLKFDADVWLLSSLPLSSLLLSLVFFSLVAVAFVRLVTPSLPSFLLFVSSPRSRSSSFFLFRSACSVHLITATRRTSRKNYTATLLFQKKSCNEVGWKKRTCKARLLQNKCNEAAFKKKSRHEAAFEKNTYLGCCFKKNNVSRRLLTPSPRHDFLYGHTC